MIINILTVSAASYLLFCQLGIEKKKLKFMYIGIILIVAVISLINSYDVNFVIAVSNGFNLYPARLIFTTLFLFFALIVFKGNISEKIMWGFVPMLIIAIADMIPLIVVSLIMNISIEEVSQLGFARFLMTLIHIGIIIGSCILLSKTGKKKLYIPNSIRAILILIILLGTISTDIMIDNIVIESGNIFYLNMDELVIITTFVLLVFSIFILETKVGTLSYENMEYELEAQQKVLENKSFENIDIAVQNLRELRHELKNNYIVMQGLLANKNYDELDDYFQNVYGEMTETTDLMLTENPIVNSLLYSKILIMRAEGIVFHHQICAMDRLRVKPYDICSILGNLLDNAIEANRKVTVDQSRYINFFVKHHENMLLIKVENSYNGIVKKIGDKRYISTKGEKDHGLGLRHIARVIHSYKGHLQITPTKTTFDVTVLLPYLMEDMK